jgi:FkbM family methyltransferase
MVDRENYRLLYLAARTRGIDIFDDIKNYLATLEVKVVFDVGANIGQSAQSYLKNFAESKIYCFEPVEETFLHLQRSLRGHDNILTFKIALSSTKGTGKMVLEGPSDQFFLLNTPRDGQVDGRSPLEEVNLETIDEFCREHKIDRINFLKIDAEGGDFNVLMGADEMLSRHQIDVVQVEAGMNSKNKRHVPFNVFSKFFEQRHYFLFGIYEQVNEWPTKEPHLRRTNPVFISDRVIKANIGR